MEIELKYACPNEAVCVNILASDMVRALQIGAVRQIRMCTDYYDTPERTLRALYWTLRLRRENEQSVVCCKTRGERQGALSSHGEWECEAESVPQGVEQLIAQGAPEELRQLAGRAERFCGAEFLRKSVDLRLSGGTVAELSCDVGKLLGSTREEALCEVELELKEGSVEPMLSLGADLAKAFGLWEEPRSKLARALALE